MPICPTCSAENPAAARFCNQCGARLDAAAVAVAPKSYTPKHLAERILNNRAAMQGERKRVTVLFCDIKGSTRLAQEAGEEAWHGILDRVFALLSAAVHRFEGTVNQYTGDGVMALFGAPLALEDHAQRACFAALEMQRELRRYAGELRLSLGLNLSLRVGLNSGEVIVGRIGDDLRMDYTAQGLTVNLAARMEHICEPGRVYLTRETARQVEGWFALRNLGPMTVAGLDERVEVHELEGEGAIKTRLDRSLARHRSPFIGREAETTQLLAALEKVKAGQGQVLAVVGEAGIGKSRLCYEFTRLCADAGLDVHRATGVPYANALPLHPVQTLTRSRLALPERAPAAEVRRLVAGTLLLIDPGTAAILPALFDFLGAGDGSSLLPEQAAATRSRLFDLLAQHLPCAEERPLVLLVEDLHFLDTASEEFFARLAAQVAGQRTLLIVNYRPDYADAWLRPSLNARIPVTALGATQLAEVAGNLLGPEPALASIAAELGARAGGNPFFVEEAVQALADAGHLSGTPGNYRLARSIADWPIPDSVHALLAARIDRLPEAEKSLLQTASVIGQEFAPQTLVELSERADAAPLTALVVLETAGFVLRAGEAEYSFRHPLMREVAYGGQLESRRAQTHARLALNLEKIHPLSAPATEVAARIAHHWQRAGEWAKAGAWCLHAIRWSGTRDMRVTVEHYRAALQNLERAAATPEVLHLRIAARAGLIRMAQFVAIDAIEIEQAYQQARALADQAQDFAGAAELMMSYANEHLHRGDADASVALVAEACRLCIEKNQREQIKRFRLSVLLSHYSAGRPLEGIAWVDRADDGAWRREPMGEDNFMSRGFYGLMLVWMGRLDEARSNLHAAVSYAEREDRAASWMHSNLVDLAWFSGELGDSLAQARQGVLRAAAFGSPFFHAVCARSLALALCLYGQYDEAIVLLEEVRPHTRPGGFAHQFESIHLATTAQALLGAGRFDQADEAAEAGIASAQRSHARIGEMNAWLAWLKLPCSEHRRARAAVGLARMAALIAESGAEGFRPWLLECQAHWSTDGGAALRLRAEAAASFAAIGALAHAQRLEAAAGIPT